MRFVVNTKPEKMRLCIHLSDEEISDFQTLIGAVHKLAHRAGYKKDIHPDLVPLVDKLHSKFDYGE
jgi:hypothetical protein